MKRLLVTLAFIVASTQPLIADARPNARMLKGLQGVEVLITGTGNIDEARQAGLFLSAIKTAAETHLRTHGLRVLSESEGPSSPGSPFIFVIVTCLRIPDTESFAVFVRVSLREAVYLVRNPEQIVNPASIWEAVGMLGTTPPKELSNFVVVDVQRQLDQFVNDYLKYNPRD